MFKKPLSPVLQVKWWAYCL